MKLDDIRIVLVRPRDPNNIGAAARAMANFGLSDLVVVAPFEPVWREARSAVGAAHVLASAREASSLEEATADCGLVGATTTGVRRALSRVASLPAFVSEAAALDARVALVFGNEKHGLAADEIDRCHVAIVIPTDDAQPSMNLGQAVAVCCYALVQGEAAEPRSMARSERPATAAEIHAAVEAIYAHTDDARANERLEGARARMRALLMRSRATSPDVALLRGLRLSDDHRPD